MKRVKPRTIVLDIVIAVGVTVLFGIIPGLIALVIALLWTVPSQLSRRGKIILTVGLVILVMAIPVAYYMTPN